jgi:hypothetical protein
VRARLKRRVALVVRAETIGVVVSVLAVARESKRHSLAVSATDVVVAVFVQTMFA